MQIDRKALLESVTDTSLGFIINFPLSWLVLFLMLMFTQDALLISIIQTTVITVTAIIRRYITRIYFRDLTYKEEQ
jgi:hypothetical protein|tara:strand:- start:7559 stop:7786 length:228 start_codon:yes stop_codon:yes gene_type:complete